MIERESFAVVMAGFADRFGRALSPATAEMYYELLSGALSTEEFLAGARILFQHHPYNAWPPPQAFIDAVKPKAAAKLNAAEVFEHILSIDSNVYTPIDERFQKILALGPVAVRAYRAAGGRREFENVLVDDVKWLSNRFVEAFEAASAEDAAQTEARIALEAVDPAAAQLIAQTATKLGAPIAKQLGEKKSA